MKKTLPYLLAAFLLVSLIAISNPAVTPKPAPRLQPRVSGAGKALDLWSMSRTYPNKTINMAAWSSAVHQWQAAASTNKTTSSQWESMGPHNIGGRTLRLAFNPLNPSTLYAGSAAGGLWRSHTAGIGPTAWHRVATGFPVLGVAAIAVHPVDTNIIVIGTGELYNDGKTGNRVNVRLSRGSYGIGILRSTDNGQTWAHTLNWAYEDLRGVQDIAINPGNPSNILAATSEGIYQSLDAGATWTQRTTTRMANDIIYHPNDPTKVMVAVGNLGSLDAGIYTSADAGTTFTMVGGGLPAFSGKVTLSATNSAPYWVYASVADSLSGYGVFKTEDWGSNWSPVLTTDYQTYQGWYSHDLAVNPWNRNEIIFGGIDAWMTSTGGTFISRVSDWGAWDLYTTPPIGGPEGQSNYIHADIHNIIYHPTDSNQIYFATDGGVFRSYDGGASFEGLNGMLQTTQFYADFSNSQQDSLLAIGGLQDNATAVYQGDKAWYRVIGGDGCCTAIDPYIDDVIYASTQYATMWNSNDRGLSFNYLSNQPPANSTPFVTSFALCPESPLTIYACTDYVAVTGDGGAFWSTSNGGNVLNGNNVIRVAVGAGTSCNLVYAAVAPGDFGRAALYKTTDGGGSWANVTGTLPDRYYHDIVVHPTNSNIAYVVLGGFGTDHVYMTIDQGASWFPVSSGLPNAPANTLAIDPANLDNIFLGNDVGVYFSPDAGTTWAPFGTGLPESMIAMDLSISPSNRKLRVATHGSGVFQVDLPGPAAAVSDPLPTIHYASVGPNPAHGSTTLHFALAKAQQMDIKLVDLQGRTLREFASSKSFAKGSHDVNLALEGLEAGIYFVAVQGQQHRAALRLAVF